MGLNEVIKKRDERKILAFVEKNGIPKHQVEVLPELFANRKPDPNEDYYYYDGPLDEKTRDFCKRMLKIDKVFSTTDIEILSNQLNYDVLKYRGSYNCRHRWIRFRGRIISTPEPTVRQLRDLISKGIPG